MKINKIILYLFLLQHISVTPHQAPFYFQFLPLRKKLFYADNCLLINITQNIRGVGLLAYYYWLTYKNADAKEMLEKIKQQITEFATELVALEEEALTSLKNKYQIPDEVWQKCTRDIERIKQVHTKALLYKQPNIVHDSTIPTDIKEMLITLLQENNINPQAINLIMITEQPKDNNVQQLAQTKSLIKIDHNMGTIEYDYIPCTIEIFPAMLTLSATDKLSTCAHEIQHLIQHHGLTDIVVATYLQHYTKINKEELRKSPEYHKLLEIHEAQAEILSAVNNAQIAASHKQLRKNKYYPGFLYEEHFLNLCSIDMFWRLHESLQTFVT